MSGQKGTRIRPKTDIDRLRDQITDQARVFNNQLDASKKALEEQKKVNERLNNDFQAQQKKSERVIANLKSDMKQSQEKLQEDYEKKNAELNNRLESQRKQFSENLAQQKKTFDDSIAKERYYREQAIARQGRELNQRIDEETRELNRQLVQEVKNRKKMINDLRDYTNNQITQVRQDFDKIFVKQQQEINNIKVDVSTLIKRNQNSKIIAENKIHDLNAIIESIYRDEGRATVFDYERFCPGQLQRRTERINDSITFLNNGNEQASIANSQSAINGLVDLEFNVLQEKEKFDNEYALAILAYQYLTESIKQNENIPIKGNNDGYKLNEWTNGEYQTLADEVADINNQLVNGYKTLTATDLDRLQKRREGYIDRLQAVIDRGVNRVISSQQRVDIAENIMEVLGQYHFTSEGGDYEQNDKKKSFVFSAIRKADNKKVSVSIIPDDENDFTNLLVVNTTQPGMLRSVDVTAEINDIKKHLEVNNVEVGNVVCLDSHDVDMMDVYKITDPMSQGIPQVAIDKVKRALQR